MKLTVDGVRVSLDGREIVRGAGLEAAGGELVGLVGPNGCGKSTLLRSIYRALRPSAGLISVDGDELARLAPREAARRVAVVPQETAEELDFTVAEVVRMGRTPHKRALDRTTADDHRICAEALERTGMSHAAGHRFARLSGGEKQRVLIARALAQRSPVLLLDEPTSHLDIRHQLEVLHLVRELDVTTLAVIHDLNQAAAFCDRVYVMRDGRILAGGPPAEVLTPELIGEVFGVRAQQVRLNGHLGFVFDRLTPSSPQPSAP
ncbi:ABC transporter ATP-binding protein [Nonomuraea sp. NN258]|uniref:ABC transporter ATP-binding protein n=1 Tax=Nonomuraea antri TaxID=2730852 RepID=UPI0015699896|nr:ABC transporter ATP-binding protein [Nonomuraea antri]NRQ39564.1 ABC transporter ATP-binding protein [Nonomuraea antri]